MTKRQRLDYFKEELKKLEQRTGLILKIVIAEPKKKRPR